MNAPGSAPKDSKRFVTAAGGLMAAMLASSCCIIPLLLVMLGVGGAWMGNLKALDAFQPFFIVIAITFLSIGFWQVYFKPKRECEEDTVCAQPYSNRLVKTILWFATVLIVLALTINYWAPLFY